MTENRKRVPDFFGRLYPDDLQRGSFLGTWVRRAEVDELLDEIQQLRSTLSLAEEGLANYQEENERLREALERIGHYGDEENEWDAVERYSRVRTWAMDALGEFPDGSPEPQDGPQT